SLPVAERSGELVAPHLGPAGKVTPLGLVVQLLTGLGGACSGPLALRDRGSLLAERGPRALRHVRDGLLRPRRLLRLPDVPAGCLPLLLGCHVLLLGGDHSPAQCPMA